MRVPDVRLLWRHVWPALIVLIPGLLGTRPASGDQPEARQPDVYAYGLIVFAALSVLIQRRRPGTTLICCTAAVVTYLLAGYPYGPMLIAVPVAAYGTADAWPWRRALIWNAAAGFAVFLAGLFTPGHGFTAGRGLEGLGWFIATLASVAVPTAIAAALRIRRLSELETRDAEARRAVSEERLRMAQELHDSVGHGLAVIAMQAGVALHVLERQPEKAREALEAIRAASRESLDGLRAELDVLRTSTDDAVPRRPGLGIDDIDVLVDRVRAGGVSVDADIRVRDLPPEIDVAVYRIVQESLTNVLRHAGAAHARVRVGDDAGGVVVEIADDGRGSEGGVPVHGDGRRAGSGVPGMRARAEALGGELEAGAVPGDGFRVRAWMPVPGMATEPTSEQSRGPVS